MAYQNSWGNVPAVAQTTQKIWNFIVARSSVQEIATLANIGRCQTLIWKPEDTVQSLESPRLFGRVDSTDYAATYPFLYCGRLIDFGISLYFMTYQPRKLSCFFFKTGPLTPSVEGYLDNAIFARKNHQKSIVTTQMSRVQGGHGFISVPLILFVPQLFEMNYQSILLGRVYVSKSGFNSVQIIKTPFVKVLLSDWLNFPDCVVLFIKRGHISVLCHCCPL